MKIIFLTASEAVAIALKRDLIKGIEEGHIDTWSYESAKSNGNHVDVIYHNPPQYTEDGTKNVIFHIILEEEKIIFPNSYWNKWGGVTPSHDMICRHIGRLTEMLLAHFSGEIKGYEIICS